MSRKLSSFSKSRWTGKQFMQIIFWITARSFCKLAGLETTFFYVTCLRLCGAKIGSGVVFKKSVKVHFPWNLEIGDNSWIGEEVWFINHEKVTIGSNVCISQRSIICSGGHDYRSASLEYAHKPIIIADGAWVCLDAKVLPGVTIGECSVVSAGEIVRKSLPDFSMLIEGHVRGIEPPR